ncbi:MAG TPA: class I SAM-dependent methyltransferase [Anaeromyxobacteraceae bacterium]|nr:class I SAM-dependent methyltransferase [Anaeromyxobacteraceae bacterium]
MPLHEVAARGFEAAAEAYDRGRPGYPAEAVEALAAALRLGPGVRVLDLGAGTGRLAALLAARARPVLAAEPVVAMRRRLAAVGGAIPLGAVAESLPFRDGSLDAVAAAQAFHWFDGPRALCEIHRVLRPGGRLGLLWNQRDDEVDWVRHVSRVVNAREGDAPRYRSGLWRTAFEGAPGLFGPLQEYRFRHVQWLPRESVVDQVASVSFVAAMPEEERALLLDEVRRILERHPDTHDHAEVPLACRADLFWCERR